MTIFYYTTTGNCLEVAKKLGGTLISIPAVMKGDVFEFTDEAIGLVIPNHHADIPQTVKDFLDRVKLFAGYFFGIVTYGEMNADTNYKLFRYAEKNGIRFDYINSIKMVDSSFVYWDIAKQIENLPKKEVDKHIAAIKADIEHRVSALKGMGIGARLVGKLTRVLPHETKHYERFYVEKEKCISCGICAKVCPTDNIVMVDGHPKFLENCVRCGACTHNCPKNAIRYRGEKSHDRYRNRNVTLQEIIKANNTVYEAGNMH